MMHPLPYHSAMMYHVPSSKKIQLFLALSSFKDICNDDNNNDNDNKKSTQNQTENNTNNNDDIQTFVTSYGLDISLGPNKFCFSDAFNNDDNDRTVVFDDDYYVTMLDSKLHIIITAFTFTVIVIVTENSYKTFVQQISTTDVNNL